MNAEKVLGELDADAVFEQRRDGYWAAVPSLDVRAMACKMLGNSIRFITLTAMPLTDKSGGYRLLYSWDDDGALINISTTISTGCIQTISDLLPAADWVEREIRDYYALEFEGRADTLTLMLREGDEPGLFSRTCDLGHETDPAQTARNAVAADQEGDPQ